MNDGSYFERLVKLIQEAYKDFHNTKIHLKHKLRDNSGDLREFDVVVETSVNDYKILIVIECKDHKRRVERSLIESFVTKCQSIPSINKRIFVSSNGFQIGAQKTAEKNGILLFKLEKLNQDNVKNWLIPQHIYKLKMAPEIGRFSIGYRSDKEKIRVPDLSHPVMAKTTNGMSFNLSKLIIQMINQLNKYTLCQGTRLFVENNHNNELPFTVSYDLPIRLKGIVIESANGENIALMGALCEVKIRLSEEIVEESHRRSYSSIKNEEKAQMLSTDLGDHSVDLIYKKGNGAVDTFLTKEDGTSKKLTVLSSFDPKTGKWVRSEHL